MVQDFHRRQAGVRMDTEFMPSAECYKIVSPFSYD